MKRHKRMNRRITSRMKAAVSALLVSSMVLNPWYGIDLAVGSENNSTRVRVSGLTGGTVQVNLESAALKEEALRAIRESAPTELENYLSTDSSTDAAVAKLLSDPNPYYTVALWTAEDEEVFAAEGIDVKVLVQRDASSISVDEDNVASASNLKKAGQYFSAAVKNRKDKDVIFYPAGGTLDTLLMDFQADTLGHAAAEAESLDNSDYELTGDEKITILYMNTDTKSHSFKLSVDGNDYSTAVKVSGTGTAAKSMLNKLKAVMNGETETATVEEETTTAAEDNVLNPTSQAETKNTEEFKNTEETGATASESAATEAESRTDAAPSAAATEASSEENTTTEAQTAEVSQEETAVKEKTTADTKEQLAEAVIKEVEQLGGKDTVTAIGAFTLPHFYEEAQSEEVQTEEKAEAVDGKTEEKTEKVEEKAAEAEKTAEADTTTAAEENTVKKEESTTAAAEGTSAASREETTTADTAENKTEETTAVETTTETTEEETKAKTAMDESLAAEQKQLLSGVKAEDLAAELKSARLVQYTLGDLTSDFISKTLTDADGNDIYVVRVSAVDTGAIGDDWSLAVKEIVKDDEDAVSIDSETMSDNTKTALEQEGLYDQSRSLDIHLEDADGNAVEPNGKVKVEIELSTAALPEDVNPENLQVYHLEEKEDGSVKNVTNVANPENIQTLDADGAVISKSQAVEKVEVESTETTETEGSAEAAIMTAELAEAETAAETTSTEVARLSGEVAKLKTSFEVESFSTFTISWYDYKTRWARLSVQLTTEDGADIPNAVLAKALPEYVYSNNPGNKKIETSGTISFGTGENQYGNLTQPAGYSYVGAQYIVDNDAYDIDQIDYKVVSKTTTSGGHGGGRPKTTVSTYTIYLKYQGNVIKTVNCGTRTVTTGGWNNSIDISSNDETISIRLKYKKNSTVTIKDTSTTDGRFTVELDSSLSALDAEGKLVYKWYRIPGQGATATDSDYCFRNEIVEKVNGEALQSEDGKSLNVVLDHMYQKQKASEKSYYYVKVFEKTIDENRVETLELKGTSTPQQVQNNYEIQNGGFEKPEKDPTTATSQIPVGTTDLVWNTTGIGAISNDGNDNNGKNGWDIEIIRPAADKNTAGSEFGLVFNDTYKIEQADGTSVQTAVPEGYQCAELNASAEGALYQDVLTARGSTLNWQFYHRTRKRDATTYGSDPVDKMSVLIMPTAMAVTENITTKDALDEFVAKYASDPSKYTGVYKEDFDDDNYSKGWVSKTGEYTATSYMTRFFFLSGKTAYDNNSSLDGGEGTKFTVGNLIDDVRFTTDNLPVTDSGRIVVTKKVYGITREDIDNGYAVHLDVKKGTEELIGGANVVFYNAEEKTGVNGSKYFEASTTISADIGSTYYIKENGHFFSNDTTDETQKKAFDAKYKLETTTYNPVATESDDGYVKLAPTKSENTVTGNTLTITNTYTSNTATVTITKNVVGTYVSSDRKYSFTASFSNIPTAKQEKDQEAVSIENNDNNKVQNFELQDNGSITFTVPIGTTLELSENNVADFTVTYAGKDAENRDAGSTTDGKYTVEIKDATNVTVTNTSKVTPTGVRTSGMAGVMAIVMGFGLMGLLSAGYVMNRRKRW